MRETISIVTLKFIRHFECYVVYKMSCYCRVTNAPEQQPQLQSYKSENM